MKPALLPLRRAERKIDCVGYKISQTIEDAAVTDFHNAISCYKIFKIYRPAFRSYVFDLPIPHT